MTVMRSKQLKPGTKVIYKEHDGYPNSIKVGDIVTVRDIDQDDGGIWLVETDEHFAPEYMEVVPSVRKRRGSKHGTSTSETAKAGE